MPTLFCLKKTGKPSSKSIRMKTIKKMGDRMNKRIQAKTLDIIWYF